jgi:pimeloyl-ACP methyl ester carboxylesterase
MRRSPGNGAAEAKLWQHPTLAVYGDGDGFVPVGKLRSWTTRMEGMEGSKFRGREIRGAGHFWIEEGVLARMTELIDDFVRQLVG